MSKYKLGEKVWFITKYNEIDYGYICCITLKNTRNKDWFDANENEDKSDDAWVFKPRNNRADITQLIEEFRIEKLFKSKNEAIDYMIKELEASRDKDE